jgi:hypothetical protein
MAGEDNRQEDDIDLKDIDKSLKKLVDRLDEVISKLGDMGKATKNNTDSAKDWHTTAAIEKRKTSEAYFENLKEMALFRKSLKDSGHQFNFLTSLLTKGTAAVTVMGHFTNKLQKIGENFDALGKATRDVEGYEDKIRNEMKKKNITGSVEDNQTLLSDKDRIKFGQAKENKKNLTEGGAGGSAGKYMSKMMQFADKHKTGLVLGSGVATILLKVLKMAFDASPMFQQIKKLLQFGVMMVLRPIGDFFGFLFRPIMIMLLRKFIIPWYTKMYPVMMQMGDIIGRKLAGAFEALAEGDVMKAFGILFADVTWENVFKDSFKGLKQWYEDGLTGITTSWDKFWDATILWFETGIGTALGTWSEIWDGLIGWVTDGMTILATASSWSDLWDKILAWFQKGIDGYLIQFSDIWGKIVAWLKDVLPFGLGNFLFPEAGGGADEVVQNTVETGANVVSDIATGATSFFKDPVGVLTNAWDDFWGGGGDNNSTTTHSNTVNVNMNSPTSAWDAAQEMSLKSTITDALQEINTKRPSGR